VVVSCAESLAETRIGSPIVCARSRFECLQADLSKFQIGLDFVSRFGIAT
jgi:hypothetical protein